MGHAVTNSELSRRFGALTTPSAIQWDRININGLLRTLARLNPDELQRFRSHLKVYEKSGKASEYLLGVLALAAGQRLTSRKRALVLKLQPNVIGLVFT
ncbi:hypothetical protein [Ovoidimarina sediminis]|uniref:hypothetical protein n=1 Tax=Ovoidimarina sediminis TaxID=3079856 RepID=UPI00290C699E|nr:hypothetical protein [Rhodophyticola sp. MJ-SS7]MDU8946742.1 hypothetical protein [Rhodophyticola sp. MJ-SS7]